MTDRLSVEVNARMTIPLETAERCLKLLEMWQNDNPDMFIEGENIETETGRKTVFKIRRRTEY